MPHTTSSPATMNPPAKRIPASLPPDESHSLERKLQRYLLNEPTLQFSSLEIHRMRDGVCLKGVVRRQSSAPQITQLIQTALGLDRVVNQLVEHQCEN